MQILYGKPHPHLRLVAALVNVVTGRDGTTGRDDNREVEASHVRDWMGVLRIYENKGRKKGHLFS
jgi:hypothetical protein